MLNIKLLRLSLGMNPATAARYLVANDEYPDGASETTWLRWERGEKPVPLSVMQHLQSVVDKITPIMNAVSQMPKNMPTGIAYHKYSPVKNGNAHWNDVVNYHIELAIAAYAQLLGITIGAVDG